MTKNTSQLKRLMMSFLAQVLTLSSIVSLSVLSLTVISLTVISIAWSESISTESESQRPLIEIENIAINQAYLDLEVIVTSQERSQWVIDQHALHKITPQLMEVLCQLTPRLRLALQDKLLAQGTRRGQAREYWLATPKDSMGHLKGFMNRRTFKKHLHRERIMTSLSHVQERIKQCPYWLPESSLFMGVHRDAGRLQLLVETMGGLQLQTSEAGIFVGGAGQGRLIVVYGFGASWGLGLGLEAGGASTFPKDDQGERSVRAEWTAGAPILIRTWLSNYRLDAELTPVVRFNDHDPKERKYGGRFAVGFGFSPLRVLGVLPHIMAWAGSERYFDQGSTTVYRAGTRIGFSL